MSQKNKYLGTCEVCFEELLIPDHKYVTTTSTRVGARTTDQTNTADMYLLDTKLQKWRIINLQEKLRVQNLIKKQEEKRTQCKRINITWTQCRTLELKLKR